MPEFKDLPPDFCCPYRHGCPYLEGLSTNWVFNEYKSTGGIECGYEHQLEALQARLDEEQQKSLRLEVENKRLAAELHALHRRQFKGRKKAAAAPDIPAPAKKRGAPLGHAPWSRPKPKRIDQVVAVPPPDACPHCGGALEAQEELREHVQEDILLAPRTTNTCYVHRVGRCRRCDRDVLQPGPGELLGSYIGPVAKATAIYLRYDLNVPDRKISRFFEDLFGLKFVPASAYGFERQAVRRGAPLYEDLRQKIRALPVAHADETTWRHDGQNYWTWYAGDDDLAFFHLDPHRTTEAAQSVWGERFKGIIVADALASYKGVRPKDWQSCLAHIKTKAKELEQEVALLEGKACDPKAHQFCQDIQAFVHTACQEHHQLARSPWRAKAAKKKESMLRKQLRAACKSVLTYPKAESFRKRLLGPEQKHLFTCFRHPNVPPTNNQAERSLRPLVVMRKVVQCTRSEKGLENHSVLRSLFETARRQGKKPREFFQTLFSQDAATAQAALYRRPLAPPAASRKPP